MKLRRLLGLIGLLAWHAQGQTTLQVATRTIEQHYESIRNLTITGERADIDIRVWDKETIQINVNLSARHPDRAVARKELESLQFTGEKSGKRLFLRNFLIAPASGKLTSSFKTSMVIWLPAKCPLVVKQNFGSLKVTGLQADFQASTEFSKISLKAIQGEVQLESHYGDLEASNLSGKVRLNTEYTNLKLSDVQGSCTVRSQGGEAEIRADRQLVKLEVKAQKTNIRLLNLEQTPFTYQLQAEYGQIELPRNANFTWQTNTPTLRKVVLHARKGGLIDVQTTFATISLH
ncbi:DUF4097 family beta strand repeat-containing protein [Siphonobacter curvatus]|uniref:DUF4097 domain-containing protein n=1 Tax=Siphonobacter curvatus TaxID=2094562 RepID=A0A2S7IMJ8_9BACT|nr:DUF4097 family beta strand repeat-containing protein [Siphonobacter curvatus]PQA58915.1 hypothetical protein C5O19_04455 [Siphonobacter curvatus]